MRLFIAIKAFVKALKDPQAGNNFLADTKNKGGEKADATHLRLLLQLQQSGRFIDFLKEDISSFNDAQVGAVVRDIHAGCSQHLEDVVTIRPIFEEDEGSEITVDSDYDASEVRLFGNIKGKAPFKGVLRHKGWKAHKHSLPEQLGEQKKEILAPAEIEVR